MDKKVLDAAHIAFPKAANTVTLGSIIYNGESDPDPIVSIPIAMMNRHGLIAGATGTGKTRTLQLIAEQLSQAGVPVFVADIKGDISGLGAAGASNDRITTRAKETGFDWKPSAFPVEFLSLSGTKGAQLRATEVSRRLEIALQRSADRTLGTGVIAAVRRLGRRKSAPDHATIPGR